MTGSHLDFFSHTFHMLSANFEARVSFNCVTTHSHNNWCFTLLPETQKGLGASTESLDKLDDDGVDPGIPLLTVPDWSVDLVAQWMDGVKLGKYSSAVKEKNFTGKQLLECESGKLKVPM